MQQINGIEEKDLVNRIILGDKVAFGILFRYYYPGLIVFAKQFVFDDGHAEEIVQDFFVRFWEKHHLIQEVNSLKSYFFSSIRNHCLNELRHKKIKQKYVQELKEYSSQSILYDPDLYVISELQMKIKDAIESLPERCREVFELSRINGLKNEEIAQKLNISKRTVETQISKALKTLRVELKDYIGLLTLLCI